MKIGNITIRKKLTVYIVVGVFMILHGVGIIQFDGDTLNGIIELSKWFFIGQGAADAGMYWGQRLGKGDSK